MATGTRKAILLQDVDHLGARGDVVNVSRGYLRNYLVPRRLAEEATDARIDEIKRVESVRAAQQARTHEHRTHARLTRVVRAWYDGLEPASVRGWTPTGPGWLQRREVIACVVTTRGGSPNGSRRVARRAAASLI